MLSANPIEVSFELEAARCEDLTPLVYARLHREYPETRAMFRTDGCELVKASMLAMTIESMLDFAGARSGKFRMIECEVSSHDARARPAKVGTGFASDRALILNRRIVLSPNRTHFGGPCAGAPRDLFVAFFGVIAATLRELLGTEWSPQIDAAWRQLLSELQDMVAQS